MKKISRLAALPPEDQQTILNLCQHKTYDQVVQILAKPRTEGGLDLQTNPTALCRFNQERSWLGCDTKLMDQFAEILNTQTENRGLQVAQALTLLVQQRLFNALLADTDLDQLRFPFRVLFNLQRYVQAEQKLNREAEKRAERAEWQRTCIPGVSPTPAEEPAPETSLPSVPNNHPSIPGSESPEPALSTDSFESPSAPRAHPSPPDLAPPAPLFHAHEITSQTSVLPHLSHLSPRSDSSHPPCPNPEPV